MYTLNVPIMRCVLRFAILICLLLSFAFPSFSQEQSLEADNPLAQLKDEVKRVLAEASQPFSEDQEKAIILMMEDRRKASEDLFGGLMDFRAGPTQGQEADRLRSAIEWMRNEFLGRLQNYLTPPQISAWSRFRETASAQPVAAGALVRRPAPTQTQYVRINNNAFTSEDDTYRLTRNTGANTNTTEVTQRGGVGAFHGNAQLLLKDESLNAGKRFASNKPPYQERRTSFDVSGPTIPGRLTTSLGFNQTEAENVDTIRATLPENIFSLGITRPATTRTLTTGNTLQLADAHSLTFNLNYQTVTRKNQGVGGFVLPERAYDSDGNSWNVEVKQFSSLSARSILENRFNWAGTRDETTPVFQGLKVNVIDAFSGGGAQNEAHNTGRTYQVGNLFTRLGEKLTLRLGGQATYRTSHIESQPNFVGTFTFSSLDAYRQNRAVSFRVTRGNPITETNQWETGLFFQNDFKVSPRLTLMYGLRYEVQTNVKDHNNFDPRVGIAYGLGRATVIRAGAGAFHLRVPMSFIELQNRLDGQRQYEIVIDSPSYPDPFVAGTVRNTFPSIRVNDPDMAAPYTAVAMASVERTFFTNLFVSASYDSVREIHRLRWRNLNAARDITSTTPRSCTPGQTAATCVRPQPDRGNIINMESTGTEHAKTLRLGVRDRFSIFNVSANYTWALSYGDSLPQAVALGGAAGAGGGGSDNFGFGAEGLPSDNYDLSKDRSQTALPEHTVNSTVNAQLPLGVFLTSTMTATSGRLYTVTTGKDDNMDSTVNDRPNGLLRNTEQGPMALTFNFNFSKAFFFGAGAAPGGAQRGGGTRKNINLFANLTNAFNHPNYNSPSGVLTSPNFGRSTSAGTPREIEVGLRFQF